MHLLRGRHACDHGVRQDPEELNRAIRDVTAAYIACGVDPKRSIIFNQSQVGEHAELAWIFNCVARLGWLERMTQFKEKAGKDKERASVGLYVYPNLMAADILLYHATHVPVGEDQKQHLEARARHRPEVQCRLRVGDRPARLRGGVLHPARAVDPGAGDPCDVAQGRHQEDVEIRSGRAVADQADDAETIARKIRKARTDPEPLPREVAGLKNRAEAENLVGIFAALAGTDRQKGWRNSAAGRSRASSRRWPIWRWAAVADRRGNAPADRRSGANRPDPGGWRGQARAIAQPILHNVKRIVGFVGA